MQSGVYQILNKVSKKRYIGSTNDLIERFKAHKRDLRKGKHFNPKLQNAWNKYGEDSFEFEVISCSILEHRINIEQFYISAHSPKGLYNVALNVEKPSDRPFTKEHKEKIKNALAKNRSNPPGVWKSKGQYSSNFYLNGKTYCIARHATEEEAINTRAKVLEEIGDSLDESYIQEVIKNNKRFVQNIYRPYKGYSIRNGFYVVTLEHNRSGIYIGTFNTPEEATRAHKEARKRLQDGESFDSLKKFYKKTSKGFSFDKKRGVFQVTLVRKGEYTYLGAVKTEEEALKLRKEAEALFDSGLSIKEIRLLYSKPRVNKDQYLQTT